LGAASANSESRSPRLRSSLQYENGNQSEFNPRPNKQKPAGQDKSPAKDYLSKASAEPSPVHHKSGKGLGAASANSESRSSRLRSSLQSENGNQSEINSSPNKQKPAGQDKSPAKDYLSKASAEPSPVRHKSLRQKILAASAPAVKESPEPGRRMTRKAIAEEAARLHDEVTGRPVRHRRVPQVDPLLIPAAGSRRRDKLAASTAAFLSAAASAAEDAAATAATEAADAKAAARAAGCEDRDPSSGAARGLEDDLACPICSELLVRISLPARMSLLRSKTAHCLGHLVFNMCLKLSCRNLKSDS
jgi:hypothetical protein